MPGALLQAGDETEDKSRDALLWSAHDIQASRNGNTTLNRWAEERACQDCKRVAMELEKALYFRNRYRWREWLGKNHDTAQEIWLFHYKKNSGKAGITYDEAVEEAICFGWIDGKLKSIDNEKFILRYSPRKSRSVWSKLNKERAEKLIKTGRMTDTGLAKIEEAKKNGYWDKAYTNKKKDEIPDDLKDALLKDIDAWSNFNGFANSYRNMYIGWVQSAKAEETRQRRIAEVVGRSLLNKKPGIE